MLKNKGSYSTREHQNPESFQQALNQCPGPPVEVLSWNRGGGELVHVLSFFARQNISVFYSSIGPIGIRISIGVMMQAPKIPRVPTTYFDKQAKKQNNNNKTKQNKTKTSRPNICPNYTRILPEFCPILPEFLHWQFFFWGGGAQCPPPISYAYAEMHGFDICIMMIIMMVHGAPVMRMMHYW